MKKLLFIVAIAAISTTTFAQKKAAASSDSKIIFSLGVEAGLPVGSFGDFYSFGIGGSLQGEYLVAKELGITLNAGYIDYLGKTINGVKVAAAGIVPVMAGLKYNFTGGPYIHGQLGAGFGTQSGAGTSFAYAAGIGYGFTKAIDAEVKYQAYSNNGATSGTVGLRLAYNFGQ